jgi:hypothetical protein
MASDIARAILPVTVKLLDKLMTIGTRANQICIHPIHKDREITIAVGARVRSRFVIGAERTNRRSHLIYVVCVGVIIRVVADSIKPQQPFASSRIMHNTRVKTATAIAADTLGIPGTSRPWINIAWVK